MFLGKIKQHTGKISFFVINVLIIGIGALYLKQKRLEDVTTKAAADNLASSISSIQTEDASQQQLGTSASVENASSTGNVDAIKNTYNATVTKVAPVVTQTVAAPQTITSVDTTPRATTKKS